MVVVVVSGVVVVLCVVHWTHSLEGVVVMAAALVVEGVVVVQATHSLLELTGSTGVTGVVAAEDQSPQPEPEPSKPPEPPEPQPLP